ncbi:MAG: hypothetical protein RJB66_216 [Pseudomonadota bacterium]|jgi:hypothetical protein
MDLEPQKIGHLGFNENNSKWRSKTADRMSYEAEVDVIRSQIGDLEDIRFRLGLSARKISQLLMVDPSAWTRWTKKITPPPPHIFRALQWYLLLQEKNPGFTPQVFLASHWHSSKRISDHEASELKHEITYLREKIQALEASGTQADKIGYSERFLGLAYFTIGALMTYILLRVL